MEQPLMDKPLRLTTFEEFLLWEDRPAYPWSIFTRLQFRGHLDRSALRNAVEVVASRHRLLRSRLIRKWGRWYWDSRPISEPSIVWSEGPTRGPLPELQHLNLESENGFRVFVVEGQETTDLTLQFHHACIDGQAVYQVANELLIAYVDGLEASEKVEQLTARLPDLANERLRRRGKYGLTPWKLLKQLPRQLVGLQGAKNFLQRKPVAIRRHEVVPHDAAAPSGYPAVLSSDFTAEQTRALRTVAKRLRVTVNDILTRDLFLAIDAWRSADGADRDEWLRMMIPISLRAASDRATPAANIVSSVFLDRRGADFDDSKQLLASVHDEIKLIRDYNLGMTFLFSLKACSLIPGGLKSSARKDQCASSCIFTNLGSVLLRCPLPKQDGYLVAGDAVLERIESLGPIRPYSAATFAATTYAGRLSLSLHYDPRPLSADDAKDLLDRWFSMLNHTMESSSAVENAEQ